MNRVTQLIDCARTQTGLENFGDESFREGLEILVDSIDHEARLNKTGIAVLDGRILSLLNNRLQVEEWYRRHPEIDDETIVAPLIGIGLPRTGSTALACMLGEDSTYRSLRNWEAMSPCPPPGFVDMRDDSRIAQAELEMARRAQLFPRMTAMLPSTATSPTECQLFMGYDFKSQIFQAFANIPSYVEWLNYKADLVPTYRYVKRVLKLLQWRTPMNCQWRLKNPSHSLFINALNDVFPDARFVMTHRDVASVIPSVADVYLELQKALSSDVDRQALGRSTTEFCELAMRRMISFRDAGNNHRFFDIHFGPFQRDPYPSIEALYGFLGAALSADARANMQAWQRKKPREENGYARTQPADFGLNAEALRKRFKFYSDRFGITAAATDRV